MRKKIVLEFLFYHLKFFLSGLEFGGGFNGLELGDDFVFRILTFPLV